MLKNKSLNRMVFERKVFVFRLTCLKYEDYRLVSCFAFYELFLLLYVLEGE